ncbi:MAG: excinuclease ABC subunit UvrA [Anaerolineae bacterium]
MGQDAITIKGARLHNLKNVTLTIPKNRLVVFTGLSGSGKSTLAFDTLHKEGQRQYLESLGLVGYGLSKPQVDAIIGLSPSISVDQHLTNRSPRSTVGTVTEVFTYLRVLFARLGHRPCPACGADIPPEQDVDGEVWDDEAGDDAVDQVPEDTDAYPCPACGALAPRMAMGHFSFNKPAGACPACTGLGVVHEARVEQLVDEERSIVDGAVYGWDAFTIERYVACLRAAGEHYGFVFDAALPVKALGPAQRDLLLHGVNSPQFRRHYPHVQPPATVRHGRFEGVLTNLLRRYADHIQDADYRERMDRFLFQQTCPECQGTRLRPASRQVTVVGQNIVAVSRLPLAQLADWIERLRDGMPSEEWIIAEPIVTDLRERVRRLVDVGVGYLTLERSSPTLSAGEAQRLCLAALLGSGLTGVMYILDEPTIGLHPRDTGRLVKVLRDLRDLENTVLVVEHDPDVMRASDYLVDIGPGAGRNGGRVVAAGSPAEVAAHPDSTTGQYLSGRVAIPLPERRRPATGRHLTIRGARAHNLKNLTVSLPLGMLVAVTGVSGSGKSSLMFDILDRAARQRFNGASDQPGEHDAIEGWEHLGKVVTLDQTAIARTPRSNAATYTDAFGPIRDAFAATAEARRCGLSAKHFSFNVPGGRCDRCEGAGVLTMEMHFLPDVQVRCPACHGRRFKRDVLAVQYRGHDVASVLQMTIEEALALFQDVPAAAARLGIMIDVGLGYLQLGQPATTLSGGEAQRVKLAKELARRASGRTLYLLDEPTTGLHMADTARLLAVLQRLVDAGNTVVVVEHNLDVIKTADWVIDLGPEGGEAGGRIVAEGTPEDVARVPGSFTGAFLARHVLAG